MKQTKNDHGQIAFYRVVVLLTVAGIVFFLYSVYSRLVPDATIEPNKNSAALMPEGFENVYDGMRVDELRKARPLIKAGFSNYEEPIAGRVFSRARYNIPSPPGNLPQPPLTLFDVTFSGDTNRETALLFLRENILKYGGHFERLYWDETSVALAYYIDGTYLAFGVNPPEAEKRTYRVWLRVGGGYGSHAYIDWENKKALEKAFAPYQPTIDEALRELARADSGKPVEPDRSTADLMPEEFGDLYLQMTRDDLLKARSSASWVGDPVLGHAAEEPKKGLFSSVRYGIVAGIPNGVPNMDTTPRLMSVYFRGKVDGRSASEFLRQCILKYGSYFDESFVEKQRHITLTWGIAKDHDYNVFATVSYPNEQSEQDISLLIWSGASANLLRGERTWDGEAPKRAFRPFRATIDQAVKDEKAAKARKRKIRIALYSGLGVVVLLAAFLIYRRIGRKPKPLPE